MKPVDVTEPGEVALSAGIAPRAFRVPVPGFHGEVGVLAVGNGLPSGVQDRLKRLFRKVAVDGFDRDAIDSGAN